jgi:hypothetical protein
MRTERCSSAENRWRRAGRDLLLRLHDEELIPPDCFRIIDLSQDVWVRYFFSGPLPG